MKILSLIVAYTIYFCSTAVAASTQLALEALSKPGYVAIMRHAIAPGTGDPDNFSVGDCLTQRVLSAEGKQQAEQIGDFLRSNGVQSMQVYSSQWCRCLDTAQLLDFGEVTELPMINSFFNRWENKESQTRETLNWLKNLSANTPVMLVTHQVNITALTGVYPASGEVVVVKIDNGELQVVGSINL